MPLQVPDIVNIDFVDNVGKPLRIENILIGIQTFATYKNNINCFPFLSDKDGRITITKADIKDRANNFVYNGIMDYSELESAKPEIEIYLWGNTAIDRCITGWRENLARRNGRLEVNQFGKNSKLLLTPSKETEARERQELILFETCFNRSLQQLDNIVLVKDKWDTKGSQKSYRLNFPS